MEQNGQNSGDSYEAYDFGNPLPEDYTNLTINNKLTGSIVNDRFSSFNNAFNMGSPLNVSTGMLKQDVALKFDNEDFSFMVDDVPPVNDLAASESSRKGAASGSRRSRSSDMGAAHAVGPSRTTSGRGMSSQHPYSRLRPSTVPSQSEVSAQRLASRRTGSVRNIAKQNATNAYTLPRGQLNTVQPQSQQDLSEGMATVLGQMGPASSSGSVSPFISTDLNAQASGFGGATRAVTSNTFVPLVHQKLDSSRIDPAGPVPHPDPNWRAPGPSQWHAFLYDYSLLQYVTDAGLKDLLKHCDSLVSSGVPDPADFSGPAIVEAGPFNVLDAQCVWNYCTDYSKRRQQHRNNSAASRSRSNKAAQLKHWKTLALAAGAPNRDFVFDFNDPGNAPGAPPTLLAAVTQTAIEDMKNSWANGAGIGGQASVPAVSPLGFVPDQNQALDQPQAIATASLAAMASSSRNDARPTTNASYIAAAPTYASEFLPYNAAPPPTMAAPPVWANSAAANAIQFPDAFEHGEDRKVPVGPFGEDLIRHSMDASNQNAYNGNLDLSDFNL